MLADPAATGASLAAAHSLSHWTGLALPHFRTGQPEAQPEATPAHGAGPLADACRLLSFPAGDPPADAAEAALRDRLLQAYDKPAWLADFDRFITGFLAGERPLDFYSPLDDRRLPLRAALTKHRMQFLFLGEDRARVLVLLGPFPYGLYHPAEGLFLNLHTHREICRNVVHACLVEMLGQPERFHAWLQQGADPARRALVIGDMRPLHYYLQSLGALEALEAPVAAFAAAGHPVLTVADWCFIDPAKIFPALRTAKGKRLESRHLVGHQLRHGLSTFRLYRDTRCSSLDWADRLKLLAAPGTAEGDAAELRVLVSLDLEKALLLNQETVLRAGLARLQAIAASTGRRLHLQWDGWTRAGEALCERGQRVVAEAEALSARLLAALPEHTRSTRLYGLSVEEKIPLALGADLALLRHGTAAMLPTSMLGIRTLAYHTPTMMRTSATARRGTHFVLPDEAVSFEHDPKLEDFLQPFTVEPEAFCAAIDSVLGRSATPPRAGKAHWPRRTTA